VTGASRLRSRLRNRPTAGSIDLPFAALPLVKNRFGMGPGGRSDRGTSRVFHLRQLMMTGQGGRFCAGLLTLQESFRRNRENRPICLVNETEVSNSDQP